MLGDTRGLSSGKPECKIGPIPLYRNFCLGRTAKVEATLTSYEDEDGHLRIYPLAGLTDSQLEELEGQVAGRCVDLLIETGIFLCAAVYAPDL
jgi:hypothetical protein